MSDDLVGVFQAFGDAVEQVLHVLTVIVQINYEVVKLVLDTCASTVVGAQRVFSFLSIAVTDFLDQYSDWCQYLFAFLLYLWDAAVGAAQWICGIPFLLVDAIQYAFTALGQLPFVAFDSLGSLILVLVANISAFFSFICEAIIDACVFALKLPVALYGHTMDYFKDVDFTPFIVPLICILVVYLWYAGILGDLILFSLLVVQRLAVKFLFFLLSVAETLLYIFAPQVALAIRLVRIFWWPIAAVCRAIYRPCMELCKYVVFSVLRLLYRLVNRHPVFRVFLPERRHPLSRRPVTSAPKRPESNANPDRLVCCVCQDFEKTILLQPCNHLCLCSNCVEMITNPNGTRKCPICRSAIRSYVDVYL